ncbi:MAG: tetratricopeptide repeat protein [Candidatus Riflebacteria bacterium]|jgi:tetratricopeptide (TPR) repeat protein|nr:tetratricopeptide repeat protein [Candidatus Riflebacteria bacterium]
MVALISIEEKDLANQHLDRSISLAMTGKYGQAIEEARKAIEIDPDFSQAYNKVGDYNLKLGKIDEATEAYRKAIAIDPASQNSHFDLGCSLALKGDYDEAMAELKSALALDPSKTEIYGHIGRIFLAMGQVDDAVANLRTALADHPEEVMTVFTLACALQIKGEHEQANRLFLQVINRYTELTRVKSRFAEGHYYIGRSLFLMGQSAKAVEHLEKAVEFDTEAIDHHYSFGMLYSDADAFCSLAEAQYDCGRHEEARQNINKALTLEPTNKRFEKIRNDLGF